MPPDLENSNAEVTPTHLPRFAALEWRVVMANERPEAPEIRS